MRAAYVERANPEIPGRPRGGGASNPRFRGWAWVRVRAASVNHHDVWSLRGGPAERSHAHDPGHGRRGRHRGRREVIIHAVIASDGWDGDGPSTRSVRCCRSCTRDVRRVGRVPQRNLVDKPDWLVGGGCLRPDRVADRLPDADPRLRHHPGTVRAGASVRWRLLRSCWLGVGPPGVGHCSNPARDFALELRDAVFEPGARFRTRRLRDRVGRRATWAHSLRARGGRHGGLRATSGELTRDLARSSSFRCASSVRPWAPARIDRADLPTPAARAPHDRVPLWRMPPRLWLRWPTASSSSLVLRPETGHAGGSHTGGDPDRRVPRQDAPGHLAAAERDRVRQCVRP